MIERAGVNQSAHVVKNSNTDGQNPLTGISYMYLEKSIYQTNLTCSTFVPSHQYGPVNY